MVGPPVPPGGSEAFTEIFRKYIPVVNFLLLEGINDIRTSKGDGKKMYNQLQARGKTVTFKEFKAEHCLSDMPERMDIIAKWLES